MRTPRPAATTTAAVEGLAAVSDMVALYGFGGGPMRS